MQTNIRKLITTTIATLLLLSLFAPVATFALGSGTASINNGATVFFQEEGHDEEETHAEEDGAHGEEEVNTEETSMASEGDGGTAFTLTLIFGVIVIIFVVAIISAVSLGVIGRNSFAPKSSKKPKPPIRSSQA